MNTTGSRTLLLAVLVLAMPQVTAQGPQPRKPPAAMAEFPRYDRGAAAYLRPGLASAEAEALRRINPDSLETLEALVAARRTDDAIRTARQLFDLHPERIAAAMAVLSELGLGRNVPGQEEGFRAMLAHARSRLAALGRNERAEGAYAILQTEPRLVPSAAAPRQAYVDALRSFVAEYGGTPAALEAEVDLLDRAFFDAATDRPERHGQLLVFARAHPDTVAGAKALYLAGFHLAHNDGLLNRASGSGSTDPTSRILQIVELVRELRSGRYPACRWTTEGASLPVEVSSYGKTSSPQNIETLLTLYSSIAVEHGIPVDPNGTGAGTRAAARAVELCRLSPGARTCLDRFFDHLAGAVPDGHAVRYFQATQYLAAVDDAPETAGRTGLLAEAHRLLQDVYARSDGLLRRLALATLASRAYYERDWPRARDRFARYAREFPGSHYAWVAALRVGLCHERQEAWPDAAAAYREVARSESVPVVASVLADAFSARVHEAAGAFVDALALYRRARDRWDPSFGTHYSIASAHVRRPDEPAFAPPERGADSRVDLWTLESRITELERSLAFPGGANLEAARWLLTMRRWQEAARVAARTQAEFPSSPNAAEAGYLNHRARLEESLERLSGAPAGSDQAAAATMLDELAREPLDAPVAVARIARAYLQPAHDAGPSRRQQLLAALQQWQASQSPKADLRPLEQDVADIRSLLFQPNGEIMLAGARWGGYPRPVTRTPFVVARTALTVIQAGSLAQRVSFAQRFPHLDRVLSLDDRDIELLGALMARLGGTAIREGRLFLDRGVMEPPVRPAGPSLDLAAFLNEGFRVMPGHWGGWEFESFPSVTEIHFLDAARTRALARVRVGYAGGDAMLEKRDGAWRLATLMKTWIM